jgi:hypothetical protein
MAEELSLEVDDRGASPRDLVDSIAFLKRIDGEPPTELGRSLPFLEQRLAAIESAAQHAARSDPLRRACAVGSAPT